MPGLRHLEATSTRLSGHYTQAEVPGERIEIPIVVQQVIPALDASGGNHRIEGPANGHAKPSQRSEVLRCLNRDFLSAQLHDRRRSQLSPGVMKIPVVFETRKYLGQNQVTDGQRLVAKQSVESHGLRCDRPLEVIDPRAGVDQDSTVAPHRVEIAVPVQFPTEPADLRLSFQPQRCAQPLFHGLTFGLLRKIDRRDHSSV